MPIIDYCVRALCAVMLLMIASWAWHTYCTDVRSLPTFVRAEHNRLRKKA